MNCRIEKRGFLEVRIPISPRDHYFNRVRLISNSIRSLGERYSDVTIRVTIGSEFVGEDLYARFPWSKPLGIVWHWVYGAEFNTWAGTRHPYLATMMERFRPPFTTKYVLMLDADVIAIRPFDELFDLLSEGAGLAGVMAYVSPFAGRDGHNLMWNKFFHIAGLGEPRYEHQLNGWGFVDAAAERRLSPPYLNTGVLLASASALEALYQPYQEALQLVRTQLDTYFFEQVALTLALAKIGMRCGIASLRYNFPNDPRFDKAYPDELRDVRFLHFLQTATVRRDLDFQDEDAITALAARRDLTGSNEALRKRLAELLLARPNDTKWPRVIPEQQ
jgi:hypothetical protein